MKISFMRVLSNVCLFYCVLFVVSVTLLRMLSKPFVMHKAKMKIDDIIKKGFHIADDLMITTQIYKIIC